MTGLVVAVASCAVIFWGGLSIWDHFAGRQPLRKIRVGNANERRTAADDLADPESGIDAEAAIAALIAALGDDDAGVRVGAAESLGGLVYRLRVGPRNPPISADGLKRQIEITTRGLVTALSDHDPGVRAAAATGLGIMATRPGPGPRALERLAKLRHESKAARRQVVKSVFGHPDLTLTPQLEAALEDVSADVRAAAAQSARALRPGPRRADPRTSGDARGR